MRARPRPLLALAVWLTFAVQSGAVRADEGARSDQVPLRDVGFLKVAVPSGWHVKEETAPGTRAVFVTKELIERGVPFRTGLSVNGLQHIPAKTGRSAAVFAKGIIAELVGAQESRDVSEHNIGKFVG